MTGSGPAQVHGTTAELHYDWILKLIGRIAFGCHSEAGIEPVTSSV